MRMRCVSAELIPAATYFPSGDQATELTVVPGIGNDGTAVRVISEPNVPSNKIPYGTVTPLGLVVAFADSESIIFEHPSEPRNAKPATIDWESVVERACVELAMQRSKMLPNPFAETKPKIVASVTCVFPSPVDNAFES